jgi:carbamoyltransferase
VFFEKPFARFERLLLSSMQAFPRFHRVFRESMITWLGDKLWIKHLIQRRLGEAAILTVDGVGEWTTASFGIGRGTEIKLLKEIRFPHSLGLLYSAFTAFLGFEVNEGEYKVMRMAPFGSPRYTDKVYRLIRLDKDGSFELNMDYFSFHYSTAKTFNAKFVELFGPPRDICGAGRVVAPQQHLPAVAGRGVGTMTSAGRGSQRH